MKKILIFCITFFAIVLLAGRADFDAAPPSLILNDGAITYHCTLTGMTYAGNYIYSAVTEEAGYPPGSALVFFDPAWSSFAIKMFEDSDYWGFTYEGHWTGNCSTGYYVISTGATGSDPICLGPAPSPKTESSNLKRK